MINLYTIKKLYKDGLDVNYNAYNHYNMRDKYLIKSDYDSIVKECENNNAVIKDIEPAYLQKKYDENNHVTKLLITFLTEEGYTKECEYDILCHNYIIPLLPSINIINK